MIQQSHSPAPQFKSILSLVLSLFYGPTLIFVHDYWKNHSFDSVDHCQQRVTSLLLNTLSRLVIAFLPRRVFLILWLQSPSTVILEPKKTKSVTVSTFFLSICHEVIGLGAMILAFWILPSLFTSVTQNQRIHRSILKEKLCHSFNLNHAYNVSYIWAKLCPYLTQH